MILSQLLMASRNKTTTNFFHKRSISHQYEPKTIDYGLPWKKKKDEAKNLFETEADWKRYKKDHQASKISKAQGFLEQLETNPKALNYFADQLGKRLFQQDKLNKTLNKLSPDKKQKKQVETDKTSPHTGNASLNSLEREYKPKEKVDQDTFRHTRMSLYPEKTDTSLFTVARGKYSKDYFKNFIKPQNQILLKQQSPAKYVDLVRKDRKQEFKEKVEGYINQINKEERRMKEDIKKKIMLPFQKLNQKNKDNSEIETPALRVLIYLKFCAVPLT